MASSELRTILVISYRNLPEHVYESLNGYDGVSATLMTGEGYLLHVPDEGHELDYGVLPAGSESYDGIPAEVVAVWNLARKHGALYVLVDDVANADMNLPTFEHAN